VPHRRAFRCNQSFVSGVQLFPQLFTGAQANVFDRHVAARAESFESDQPVRQIFDADLVAHVQHEQSTG
jgi:hypothetical protein